MGDAARWSEELTPLRREVVARLAAREDDLVEDLVRALRTEITAYGGDREHVLPAAELDRAGRRHLRLVLTGVGDDGQLSPSAVDRLEQVARERAGQGVPLHALLQALQVGARELWRSLLEVVPEVVPDGETRAGLLAELTRASLQLSSEISATVAAAYVETGRHRVADRERIRHELLEQVLSDSGTTDGPLRRRAESVGYRFGEAHVVAVVVPATAGTAADHARTRIHDALGRAEAPGGEPLLGSHGDTKVAVYPVPPDLPEHRLRHALDRSFVAAGVHELGYHAAIGGVAPGIGGITTSYRQAAATIELARDCGLADRTLSYVRSLPWLLLNASSVMADDLRAATIEPLRAHDRRRRTDLVETCAVLLEVQGNQAEAAKRLHVHRHTLATRLRRIEELTGRSFDDRDDVLLLDLGLRADDLLGRPEGHDTAR